jgi:hypothetical protein
MFYLGYSSYFGVDLFVSFKDFFGAFFFLVQAKNKSFEIITKSMSTLGGTNFYKFAIIICFVT